MYLWDLRLLGMQECDVLLIMFSGCWIWTWGVEFKGETECTICSIVQRTMGAGLF